MFLVSFRIGFCIPADCAASSAPLTIPDLNALMKIVKDLPRPQSLSSPTSIDPTVTDTTVTDHISPLTPRCSSPSLCLTPPTATGSPPIEPTLPTSTFSVIETFDDLLSLHSLAILDYHQKWSPENAAALEFAVFDTEDNVRYHHFTTTELLNDAIKLNQEHAEVERHFQVTSKELTAKHKTEADGLRLSLHEKSEALAAAITERNNAHKERDLAVLHRNDLKKQLKELQRAREPEIEEKLAYQQQIAGYREAIKQVMEESRLVREKQWTEETRCKEALILKETAMKVVEKVTKEREEARQEIEELRTKRSTSKDRDEAVKSLSLKLGDKKRRL